MMTEVEVWAFDGREAFRVPFTDEADVAEAAEEMPPHCFYFLVERKRPPIKLKVGTEVEINGHVFVLTEMLLNRGRVPVATLRPIADFLTRG